MLVREGRRKLTELLGKSLEELQTLCAALGEPRFRAAQIYNALYAERKLTFDEMTTLPKALRERLAAETRITLPQVKQRFVSSDGSVRYLMDLPAGEEKGADAASVGGNGIYAERGTPDDLCFDAGRLRGGLPVLFDGAAWTDSEFDGRRNPGTNPAASEGYGRAKK